jgi:glutathione synthase/RimK-type ligase-like ATP-grasp enzyme
MIVGIHPNKKHGRFSYDSKRFIEILKFNKIQTKILYAGEPAFWDRVSNCDLFIFQWTHIDYFRQIAESILPIIEGYLKIKCFPNMQSSWIYDDKIRQYYLLKLHGFPVIDSWVFYDKNSALKFVEQSDYPLVFKLISGAGSRMVRLVRKKSTAKKYVLLMFGRGIPYDKGLPGNSFDEIKKKGIIRNLRIQGGKFKKRIKEGSNFYYENWQIHKNYIMFQKFLPGNSYDTRVVVIGNRTFAFQRKNLPKDFRASGSDNYIVDKNVIDSRMIKIAFQVSQTFGFDSMAYDFLYDEHKRPVIGEISYVFGTEHGSKISECPGYWDKEMNWHPNSIDAPYYIICDLLKAQELKIPAND